MDDVMQAKVEQLWEAPRVKAVRDVYERLESARVEQQKRDNPHSEFYQLQTAEPLTIDDLDEGFIVMADHAGLLNEDMIVLCMVTDCCYRFADHEDIKGILTVNEQAAVNHIMKVASSTGRGEELDTSAFFQEKNDVLAKLALITAVGGSMIQEDDVLKEAMSNPLSEGRIIGLMANACDYLQETRIFTREPEMAEKLLVACDRVLPMMKPGFLARAFSSSAAQLKKQVLLHKSNNPPKL